MAFSMLKQSLHTENTPAPSCSVFLGILLSNLIVFQALFLYLQCNSKTFFLSKSEPKEFLSPSLEAFLKHPAKKSGFFLSKRYGVSKPLIDFIAAHKDKDFKTHKGAGLTYFHVMQDISKDGFEILSHVEICIVLHRQCL